jgi:prepilin-type N-terminal cleavage/methylation domain-containing protein
MTRTHDRGFSLIEMAVVLFIVVLLLGSLIVPFATQVEQRRITETQSSLEEIKEALLGFAIANGRLPCPDLRVPIGTYTANDGQEDVQVSGICVQGDGNLPWVTLGVNRADSWGHFYRYAVSPQYSSATPFSIGSATTLTVYTRDAAGNAVALTKVGGIPAVILSQGKNGYGGMSEGGVAAAPVPAQNLDEATNATLGTNVFYARPIKGAQTPCNDNGTPACEFDDIVTWISPNVLFNRMVAAQRLP